MSDKEVFYFSHDSNARNDEKCVKLRMKYGWEGYGIFWALLERLRESADYMSVKDYNVLAFDLRIDAGKIKSIIEDFGLFAFTDDGKRFYSESFNRRMKKKEEISEKRRDAAFNRWNANAMQKQSKCNAIKEKKENKRKEIKKEFGKKEFKEKLILLNVPENFISDWFAVRDKKKAVYTETALNKLLSECSKNNISVSDAVRICAERGWQGFKYEWAKDEIIKQKPKMRQI